MGTRVNPAGRTRAALRGFVSAPFGCNVDVVLHTLAASGIQASRADSVQAGESVNEAILKEISTAQVVCVVLPNGSETSPNLFFELGVAVGSGRPVMLLVEDQVRLPSDALGLTYFRVALSQPESVERAIRAFLRTLGQKHHPLTSEPKQREKKISRSRALVDLMGVEKAPSKKRGREFEEFIANLFKRAGVEVAIEPFSGERGVDLAIWLDEVELVFGNPILIEAKLRIQNREFLNQTIEQLRRSLTAAGARCGLLIYAESMQQELPRVTPSMPLVMLFSAEELIALLSEGRFSKELVRRRNLAVHGKME